MVFDWLDLLCRDIDRMNWSMPGVLVLVVRMNIFFLLLVTRYSYSTLGENDDGCQT